jgi:hypothetical protein
MDQVVKFVEPAKQFFKDSYRLVKKCTKPDRKGNNSSLIYTKNNKSCFFIQNFKKLLLQLQSVLQLWDLLDFL